MNKLAVLALGVLMSSTALANPIRTSGTCSNGSIWQMEAQRDGNRVEVEIDVESFTPGQQWVVFLRQNGGTPLRAVRTSRGSDGYFWVERSFPNAPGTDLFEAFTRNRVTGEICRASITWDL